MATLFISEQYIKDTSYIDENVDIKLLRSTILETQDFRILPILGSAFYFSLKDTAAASWSATDRTFVNTYVAPALKYWVLHDGALTLQYKIMNKAIVKRDSENATPIDTSELDRLMDYFKIRAEFYSERITKYLLENNTTFPLFDDYGDGIDAIAPKMNNYTQGLYLGIKRTYKNIDVDKGRDNYC